jgi:peptidoglycan/xylan/chitin deacetylase (PgdA/CDA1 family)
VKALLKEIIKTFREVIYLIEGVPRGLGYIMMMHHVLPEGASGMPVDKKLNITPAKLESFIEQASYKYEFIHLEQVPDRIKHPTKKKFMVFTFDDGFQSVYINAFDILKKHHVPFTIFVSTGFTGIRCNTYQATGPHELGLSTEELLEINACPLATIGGHTINHPRLPLLSTSKIHEEIFININNLKTILNKTINTFAYPYGYYDKNVLNVIHDLRDDLKVCVLASGGVVSTMSNNCFLLPRLNLDDETSIHKLSHWRNTYMGFQ